MKTKAKSRRRTVRKVNPREAKADALVRRRASRKLLRAQYDAAATSDDNYRHWAAASDMSPDELADDWVRRVLRRRARYEVRNNSYAKGMVLTLANDTIGRGPALKMTWADGDAADRVERAFALWARNSRFAQKLRTMRMARCQDGETFGVFTTNPRLPGRIKLDVKLVEADRIASSNFFNSIAVLPDELGDFPEKAPDPIDGIVYDDDGNPVEYHVLKNYPGDVTFVPEPDGVDRIPADQVIHSYRMDRPGQRRGVPEITPALPLYAQLRRYTLAVIAAAETAADIAGVIQTDMNPEAEEVSAVEPFETIDLERRTLMSLPAGCTMNQVKAEQPTTTYGDFKKEIINEIARCLNMPFNVAAGNSAAYNYASGRLDHQMYFKSIDVDRGDMEIVVLDPVFNAFMNEAILIEGLVPSNLRGPENWSHKWVWPGREHVDPVKDATAQDIRLRNGMTTYEEEKAREGGDYYPMFEQQGRERQERERLKLPLLQPHGQPQPVEDGGDQ